MEPELRYRLLGGLAVGRVGADGQEVEADLGGPQPRRLLAALLLSLGQPISPDRLTHLVWGDEPPASARGSLQAYVSNLRRVLEPERRPGEASQRIVLRSGGYELLADRAELDVGGFERAADRGAAELAAGRPDAAAASLAEALAAWGPLLPELADVPFVRAEADRLEARRQTAFELLQTARVEIGAHHDAIADLMGAVTEHPRAERLWALLALARYRSGQPAAAIETVHQARRALRDTAGLDLGPELRRLEADLYAQAATLDATPTARVVPGPVVAADGTGPAPVRPAVRRPACRRPARAHRGAAGESRLRWC